MRTQDEIGQIVLAVQEGSERALFELCLTLFTECENEENEIVYFLWAMRAAFCEDVYDGAVDLRYEFIPQEDENFTDSEILEVIEDVNDLVRCTKKRPLLFFTFLHGMLRELVVGRKMMHSLQLVICNEGIATLCKPLIERLYQEFVDGVDTISLQSIVKNLERDFFFEKNGEVNALSVGEFLLGLSEFPGAQEIVLQLFIEYSNIMLQIGMRKQQDAFESRKVNGESTLTIRVGDIIYTYERKSVESSAEHNARKVSN